ncbi:hypothetical protein FPZ12_002360 [Amycolatopsis acidicola]|uniref:Cytosine permease n=1 Tax=Amycolatopsis acidicola TaxID=2596893 RepID=A0A5N0VLK8_9PSEU|nr:cytosine permease [Amycolatopsis acidicola]KAA9166423.1 hypothetical protein FPZ12_002360 [Amycolatopsis acidicola]
MLEQTTAEAQADGVRRTIDDNSLTPVPETERKSGWYLSWLPAGVATSLLQLTLAGTITALVGSMLGLLAGVLVAAFVLAIGWLFGNIARVEGLSGTVLPRFYGLGVRGSAISSLAFAIMIIGFCASENVLLYNGTLFALGWQDSTGSRILVYGVLTVAWIVLSMFGIKVVARTSSALVILFLLLLAYMVFRIYDTSGATLGEAFTKAATVSTGSGASRFFEVVGILGGQGAALILVNADYTRYARGRSSVGGVNLVGVIMLDLVGIALGVLVLTGGSSLAGDYLVAHGQATPAGAAAAATALATTNTGAYFVIVSGTIGFVLMYVAQAKVQVLNVYSGSLALSNLWHVLTGRTPNRFVMILVANAVCLLLIAAGVFAHLSGFISVLGMIMMGIIATAIADYYFVSRRDRRHREEPVNWAGVVTVAVSSVVSYVLSETGLFPFGFLSATVLCLVLYPFARTSLLKPKAVAHD